MRNSHRTNLRIMAALTIFPFLIGCTIDANLDTMLDSTSPNISVSEASAPYAKATGTVDYTVTYTGYQDIHLQSSDISFTGTATAGCVASVSGSGNIRTVS